MSDYISREAAIEAFEKELSAKYNRIELSIGFVGAKSILSDLPAADVVERKTGKWIKMSDVDGVYWVCSECGEDIPRIAHFNPQFDLFPRLESIDKTYFCPNCGADMRGEADG